ncbi:hypothetical protein F4810DRAFT_643836 [Camillea tinctor]|nr:hypothetical protein F4810DRAFT_643836 [Camillea tinctor]
MKFLWFDAGSWSLDYNLHFLLVILSGLPCTGFTELSCDHPPRFGYSYSIQRHARNTKCTYNSSVLYVCLILGCLAAGNAESIEFLFFFVSFLFS